uniref:Uncharacterized protein n=1 Tax=Anguilla anguilla TaxID=7936 RepID=A0A0E9PGR4_ANGAN
MVVVLVQKFWKNSYKNLFTAHLPKKFNISFN